MLPYQQQYLENTRRIRELSDFYAVPAADFDTWYAEQRQRSAKISQLRQENIALLGDHLFPALDELHAADAETIRELEDFAAALMDWSTNLDCGVYVLVHDSLLSLARVQKDRARIIRELYMLGMGLYYLDRMVEGIDSDYTGGFYFRNEMVFTEAGSYLKFFEAIPDKETRGYVIRALANIAICARDRKRRIAASAKVLHIVQDPYYRELEPGLPWDVFLRRTNQQMSANRSTLSRGNLSAQELAAVLEACHQVFEPEQGTADPNVRWLWPYYEMEYSCGFVDLQTTLERLERLNSQAPEDQYDESGLYGSVQLAIYGGILLRDNPTVEGRARHIRFLAEAYRKMLRVLMNYPTEKFDDYLDYLVCMVISDYYEVEGVPPYREVALQLMRRFAGPLYIRSQQAAAILRLLCAAIYDSDSRFFDDIDELRKIGDKAKKREALLELAAGCGLFHDLGMIKMRTSRLTQTRNLFELEDRMVRLHTVAGRDDLRARPSTARYADAAWGHHSWYNGADGYPADYVRKSSPYRQLTDAVAVVSFLLENRGRPVAETAAEIRGLERKRFSPLISAHLSDGKLLREIQAVLDDDAPYYRELYEHL